jgi:hypothetical protein
LKIIANWRQSWKWISMQTAAAATVLGVVVLSVPAGPVHEWCTYGMVGLNALTMFGRLIQQQPPTDDAVQASAALDSLHDAQKAIEPIAAETKP